MLMDAKRADIANTSAMQAKYIFDYFGADAVTLHPYMGFDSLSPFFAYKDHYNFVLAVTSNPGAQDFEFMTTDSGQHVYQRVIEKCKEWNAESQNIGLVVGATHSVLKSVRQQAEDMLFLIPGVGAQGGTYSEAYEDGKNGDGLVLINVSRSVLYSCSDPALYAQRLPELIGGLVHSPLT